MSLKILIRDIATTCHCYDRSAMHLTRPLKVLNMAHILRYTRLPPLFDEMSLAADSDKRKLYRRLFDTRLFLLFSITWVNRSLHGLGRWWTEFRTDEFWFRSLIAFTICLSQLPLTKNGRMKIIFKKGLKTWNPNFRLEFSNQENRNAFPDILFVSGIFHWNVENNRKLS